MGERCVCVCCVQWKYVDQVGEALMLLIFDNIECCNPLIPSFISCSAQTLCNRAPPFHPISFHLITYFLMFLCIFPFFSTFEKIGICVFHMEIALWVHLSTHNYPQFVSSTWSLHCGLWKFSSSWWREK
jgi:hypothetical protein